MSNVEIEMRGAPVLIEGGNMHFKRMTVLENGIPMGTVKNIVLTHPAPPKPPPPPPAAFTYSATLTFGVEARAAFDQMIRQFTPKPPKPSPKQYRLKRRAAGSKRRNKGKR